MVPKDLLTPKSQASIVIAGSFSSLSFLNAHLVGLHTKEYFWTVFDNLEEIKQNIFSESFSFKKKKKRRGGGAKKEFGDA